MSGKQYQVCFRWKEFRPGDWDQVKPGCTRNEPPARTISCGSREEALRALTGRKSDVYKQYGNCHTMLRAEEWFAQEILYDNNEKEVSSKVLDAVEVTEEQYLEALEG